MFLNCYEIPWHLKLQIEILIDKIAVSVINHLAFYAIVWWFDLAEYSWITMILL